MEDDRSDFTQSRPLQGDTSPHAQWTPVLLSEALLSDDVTPIILRGGVSPKAPLRRIIKSLRSFYCLLVEIGPRTSGLDVLGVDRFGSLINPRGLFGTHTPVVSD